MSEETEVAEGRSFLGTVIRFAILAGLLFVAAKFLNDKKNEYSELTESEARSKFIETVGPKVGDDTAEEIADQVIPKLKDRGLVKPDPMDAAADEAKEAADDLKEAADEKVVDVSDKVTEAVDSVVKD